jgi:hypothetical protein
MNLRKRYKEGKTPMGDPKTLSIYSMIFLVESSNVKVLPVQQGGFFGRTTGPGSMVGSSLGTLIAP